MIDTNVILDFILHRQGYHNALKIMQLAITDQELECVTSTSITDIHYIVGRYKIDGKRVFSSREVQELVHGLLKYLIVLETSEQDIDNAYRLNWEDYEDALMYSTSLSNGVDCIITNNVADFFNPDIPVVSPTDFLNKYYSV